MPKYRLIPAMSRDEDWIETEKPLSLASLQAFVGGYIEKVVSDGRTFIVNEEGKLRDLAINQKVPALLGNIVEIVEE